MGKESVLAAVPQAERLKQYSNNINFKIIDWGTDIEKAWGQSQQGTNLLEDQNTIQANSIVKRKMYEFLPPMEKYNNPVFLYGVDKPYIYYINGKFYMMFMDFPIHTQVLNEITLDPNNPFTVLPYYWHPDSEKILRKQAHLVVNWFRANPQFMPLLNFPHRNAQNIPSTDRNTTYNAVVNRLIYTEYDPAVWQTKKLTSEYYDEENHWWHKNPDSTSVQRWIKTVKEQSGLIYDMFSKADRLGSASQDHKSGFWKMPGCYSKMYAIS
jgi:hypothetical protein